MYIIFTNTFEYFSVEEGSFQLLSRFLFMLHSKLGYNQCAFAINGKTMSERDFKIG